jgi:hypothetical protein
MQNTKHPAGPPMTLGNVCELGLALTLGFALCGEARTAEAVYLACSGTLTISLKSQSQDLPAREEPWTFSLAVDADKKAVTIDDTSMPIMSDASENIIAFRDDPIADPPLGSFWGSLNGVTGEVNIHVKEGAQFAGACKPTRKLF